MPWKPNSLKGPDARDSGDDVADEVAWHSGRGPGVQKSGGAGTEMPVWTKVTSKREKNREVIEMVGEANQEHLDWKLKEKALELYRRLEEISELPKFDGACVDYHWDRPAVVFIPEELIAEVKAEELPKFLASQGVRRVLVDALWPSNTGVLKQIIESGVAVWVLTRPSALHGWRRRPQGKPKGLVEWLERHHPEALKGFKGDIKNDAFDAVLLRYVKPKFMMRVTTAYLECWVAMILWRSARRSHQTLMQQLAILPISEDEKEMRLKMSEQYLMVSATEFVTTVRRHQPRIDELFQKLRIESDSITQAYCCELVLEAHGSRTLAKFLRKLGLSPDMPGEDYEGEGSDFIYDGQAAFAINQLTLRIYHLDPQREPEKIKGKCKKLATKIWRYRTGCLEAVAQPGGGNPE